MNIISRLFLENIGYQIKPRVVAISSWSGGTVYAVRCGRRSFLHDERNGKITRRPYPYTFGTREAADALIAQFNQAKEVK